MDQSNRAIIVGLSTLLIAFAVVVALLAWSAPDESITRIKDLAGYLNHHNDRPAQLIVTFGAAIIALLGAIVIILEVAPPATGAVKVAKVGGGEALIATDEVTQQLERELRSSERIGDVQATVTGRGKKADIKLDLFVGAGADLQPTVEDAIRRTRELVESRMGVELANPPQVAVHYRELRAAPAAAPAAFTPPAMHPYSPPSMTPQQSQSSEPFPSGSTYESPKAPTEDRSSTL